MAGSQMTSEPSAGQRVLLTIGHAGLGLALVMGGIAGIEEAGGVSPPTAFFVLAGSAVILTTAFRQRLERWVRNYDALVQIADGFGVLASAWLAHTHGSVRLPVVLAPAGALLLFMGGLRWRTPKDEERSIRPYLETAALITCTLVVASILIFNLIGLGDFYMNVIALPMYAAGVVAMLLLRRRRRRTEIPAAAGVWEPGPPDSGPAA